MAFGEGRMPVARRPFLLGGAALAGAQALGAGFAWGKTEKPFDVVVVGGGTTGMPLAIAAAQAGGRVAVVEKMPVLGGTLDRSLCSTAAAGTSLQASAGISDSAQAHFEDVMRGTENVADPTLVRLWTAEAAATIEWLRAMGTAFRFKDGRPVARTDAYRVPRLQFPQGGGQALTATLQAQFDREVAAGRIVLMAPYRAVELVQRPDGAVTGLVAQSLEDGQAHALAARSVVIAAGGCHGSPGLFETVHGFPLAAAAGYPGDSGDGLLLGLAAGGQLRGAEHYVPMFGVAMSDDVQPSSPADGTLLETTLNPDAAARGPWEIWVNAQGKRFFAEDDATPQAREKALGKQPWHRMWTIHDQAAMERGGPQMMSWDKARYAAQFEAGGMFCKADSLAALAIMAGIDPAGLAASVKDYNAAIRSGGPDPLGRTTRPAPIGQGPFYAVRYQGWHLLTFAGLTVDGHLRVTRADGSPIPNLYAAGEVLGAAALGASGRAHGSMCTPALSFGRLLGQRLAKGAWKA
jgi:fumarate reductase flavoprotein subunit